MTMICRLCLCQPKTAHSLLDKQNFDMLEALTSIQVGPDDLSTVTCTKCLYETRLAFNIQQKILRTNEKLSKTQHDLETVVVVVKTEPVAPVEFVALNVESVKNCTICSKAVEESLLMTHIKTHFEKPQSCDLCNGEIFENMIAYKKHWNERHKDQSTCKCKDCGSTFRYRCIYLLHRSEAHPAAYHSRKRLTKKIVMGNIDNAIEQNAEQNTTLPNNTEGDQSFFPCGVCQKQFTTQRQLNTHSSAHMKKTCPICNAEITNYNFNKHVSNHNSGPQICDICGSVLSSLESLRGHMSHTHSTFRKACEECGRLFHKRYPYQLHMKKHKGEKQHICELCGKSFYTIFTLNKHTRMTHLKLRPYICTYCKKAFSSKFALKTHVRQHTMEAPYKCEVCGEGFRQNVSLRAHRKSKHNIVEPRNCKCTVCDKEFASEHAVQSHMRLHD